MVNRRIAFGVNGSPLMQANVQLPNVALRPWAFLWNSDDVVMLVGRRRSRRAAMVPLPIRTPLRSRTLPSPKRLPPLGSRSEAPMYLRDSPTFETSKASHRSRSPSMEETEADLSPGRHGAASPAASTRTRYQQEKEERHHLFEFALGVFGQRQHYSPREQPRSFSWDITKRVTSLYADVFRSL